MGLLDALRKRMAKKQPPVRAAEPAPVREPEPPGRRWDGDMVPRETGPGERIERSGGGYWSGGSVRLEWVSRQTDGEGRPLQVRVPKSRSVTVPEVGFMAAGKLYASRSQLTARKGDLNSPWARDVYGRDVLALKERFPCFDSADYLYEDRCFRWYFLCGDGKLTCVYHTDETSTVTVTEDVLDVETMCWEQMKKLGCFE